MEKKRYRIIVVEDDKHVLNFLVNTLKQKEFMVEGAANGKEALEKINKVKPDLLVTDGIMPEINGFELCRILRAGESTKDIPIIFCSASEPTNLKEKGGKADIYLHKPLDADELYTAVDQLLGL